MKTAFFVLCGPSILAGLLCGCGESKPAAPPGEPKTAASAPAPASPATVTPAEADAARPSAPAGATVETPQTATPDLTSQFVTAAKAQGDSLLGSIGTDLADKVKSLAQSAAGNDALKSQLSGSLQSLVTGHDSAALSALYQTAKEASLTPQQLQLAKEAGNLASAYVVQKNFASLQGAQGDVAAIVSSLRKGEVTPAIPAIQKVAQNASLTPTQKQLVAAIADKYAPGFTKAAGALQQGLQTLQGPSGPGK